MSYEVPFNRPPVFGNELDYVAEAVRAGRLGSGGPFSERCELLLQETMGAKRVLLTTSASTAIEMAALLARIEPGDEVILPSFSFVTCANAFALRGGRPVFVEIDPHTLCLDVEAVARAITDRTKAILVVHYAAVSCDMQALLDVAKNAGVMVIEDAAHAVGASFGDRSLGTIGDLGVLSFHDTKNITCGEGGALLVNNPELELRAEILREKGTDRTRFIRGEVHRYTWQDLGSSWVQSDLLAAFLLAQLEHVEEVSARRRDLWQRYYDAFERLEEIGVQRPNVPPGCTHNGHIFFLLVPRPEDRGPLLEHLAGVGVQAVFHFVPLHSSPGGVSLGVCRESLPVTDNVSARLVRLPLYFDLSDEAQQKVIDSTLQFFM